MFNIRLIPIIKVNIYEDLFINFRDCQYAEHLLLARAGFIYCPTVLIFTSKSEELHPVDYVALNKN